MCLSESSAAVGAARFKGKPRPFPRQRAADHSRGPGAFYHAMTVSANMDHNSPLVGGGLYALRAGRCGCDSLSLAGSRQRVKSLRSSVRLRLVFYTARLILSRRVFRCAPHTSSEGSQDSETVPSAAVPVTDSQVVSLRDVFMSGHAIRRCGQFPRYAETVRIPLVPRSSVQTLLRSTAFRGVI